MQFSLTAIGGNPGREESDSAQILGFIGDLVRMSPYHASLPFGAFIGMIDSAISVDQIRLYFSASGDCVGYVTWAYLAPDVEQRFIKGRDLRLHFTEWNEGASLWVIDFLIPRNSLPYVMNDMRHNLFKGQEKITYFRIKSGRRIVKRYRRRAENILEKAEVVAA